MSDHSALETRVARLEDVCKMMASTVEKLCIAIQDLDERLVEQTTPKDTHG